MNLKLRINILVFTLNELIDKLKQSLNNTNIVRELDFIEGQNNYITVLINDIKHYCKEVKDFEINHEKVNFKATVNFVFQILNTVLTKKII